MIRLISLCLIFIMVSCASFVDEPTEETTEAASSTKVKTAVPAGQDVYNTLRTLAPYWRRCINPYVSQIPQDEMVELALDFGISAEGRVTDSSWSYIDFGDSVPTPLRSCLDQALRTRRFQVNGSESRVTRLPIKFFGKRKF